MHAHATMKLTLCHMHFIYIVRHACAIFELWAGCYAQDGIALLVCVAFNGFILIRFTSGTRMVCS